MSFLPAHTKRLAQLVNCPGGITVNEAVTAAEQELEKLRDRGLSEIAEAIQTMQVMADSASTAKADGVGKELYAQANFLIGIGGVFDRVGLGEIARNLCSLLELLILSGRWDRTAVQLHLDSLRLASREDVSTEETDKVVAALRQVVARAATTI